MVYFAKDRLKGKIAIITASTEGIGFAIAERLACEGASIVISSRKQNNVDKAVETLQSKGLDVIGIVCHVGNSEDRRKLFELTISKYGGLDILVSNAGVNPTIGPIFDTSEEAWDKIFDINVKASYLLAKEALPYLRKRGGGKIMFMSSNAGYHPNKFIGAYTVSKTALFGLIKAVAVQLADENIQVNGLAPGIVPTKFGTIVTTQKFLKQIPLKRFGTSEDIAAAAAFLVSGDADYITGETLVIAGGFPSRL